MTDDPMQRLQDLNQQHMRSMGISGVPLGEVVRPAEPPKRFDLTRCSSEGPRGRCVLPNVQEHDVHVRGKDRWEDPEKHVLSQAELVADEIEVGLISLGWMDVLGDKFPQLVADIYSLIEAINDGYVAPE